ncbi:MAG: helix-hairpin-helix domain-containing protein, partial [Betaproteobacteria bacterium]
MLKKLLAIVLALFAAAAFAASADANKATQAELEAVKGIGPSIAKTIMDERKKAPFKDWKDLTTRVKGVGDKKAEALSKEGLTVDGASYGAAAPKAAAAASKPMKEDKKAAKKADEAASKPAK